MIDVDPQEFEVMVSEARDGIPAELGGLISNVAITLQHDGGPGRPSGPLPGGVLDAAGNVLRRRCVDDRAGLFG